ncbi:glyceraldehyde 3-phosphate dehydrogenase (NAD(P)+) [Archaeoglobus sulfaticallidus PM70-1]|uniref:Glyceraldehyde-3-phosphate dehydrogenase n=1 Tax=Archaeoglobus sulfaticallidus PM70-1 TaxID=387631 RepID=N0BF11_9EURY|nr:type II glyceraldehyde-3-phosphate dehydrogenase [Archaeoglobus sulfaticallidus]AGK61608.1 glyceraldehyde 3-phosphate dehydrogenase (NAD(P)+) [Archaeoglobus sulfaticallidus PM70-1]
MAVKVAVNGYGTIGKRVADAISLQKDMEVVGVTKTKPDFDAKMAIKKGYRLYAAIPDRVKVFESAGLEVEGTIEDLLKEVDIVVDCSPNKIGAENKKLYEKLGVKAIFQGGEKKDVAEVSFNAIANYEEAVGKQFVRVVSCNTTGLTRLIYTIKKNFPIKKVRATMIRRVVDPKEDKKGLVNGIQPNPIKLPSHHGPDVQSILPDVNIITAAFKVPTTIMHVHSVAIEMEKDISEEDIKSAFAEEPRIMLFNSEDGFTSTAKIIEFARDLRLRYDLYENAVWEDSIGVVDGEVYVTQAINQESIVIPENIDAIRAMLELMDKEESIKETNRTLKIGVLD